MNWMKELQDLNELKEQGILTQQEFDEEKSRVLSGRTTSTQFTADKMSRFLNMIFSSSSASTSEDEVQLSKSNLTLYKRLLATIALSSFVSIFLKWDVFPDGRNDWAPRDMDHYVVSFLFRIVFVALIAIAIVCFGPLNKRNSRLLGFLTPFLLVATLPLLWDAIEVLFIIPLREDIPTGEYYRTLGPGFWVWLSLTLIPLLVLSFYFKKIIERQSFDAGDALRRDTSLVIPITVLGVVGSLYSALKPNPNLDSNFGPFVIIYKANWEVWISSGIMLPILFIFASVIVAKFQNLTIRRAGVASLFYLFLTDVLYYIAMNAEMEDLTVWSFGGTLVVIAVLLMGYLLISKFSSERAIDQKITDSFPE